MNSNKRVVNLFHRADGRRLFIGLLLFLVLLPPDGLPWAARSAETFTAAATAASLQTEVPCTIEPNSGLTVPQGHTIPAVITLGPHPTVALLILVFTPEQLPAATTMRFQPGGIQVALRDVSFIGTEQIRYSTVLTIAPDTAPGVRDLNITIQTGGMPIELSCSRAFTVETPEQSLEKANQTFRDEVAQALQQIARQARVQIRTDNFVAIPLDDGSSVVVNAGIAGVENLTLEQLARGADVLFTFLRVPQGSGLPSGFYTVRIFRMGTQWKAQFKNLQGRVALETDAEVGPGDPALQKSVFTLRNVWDPDGTGGCTVDWHGPLTAGKVSIKLGAGRPDQTPLPPAGQAIAQATGNFYQAARGVINTIKVNTFRQVIIGSRDDTLVVHTAFQGVEKLTLEQLAQGQDVLFGYYRFPKGSPQPSGFYAVKIIRDTQSGEWLAQFRNMQGQVVILRHASVGVIKPAVQALRLLVEIAPVGGVTGSDVLPDGMGTGVLLPQGIAVSDGGGTVEECCTTLQSKWSLVAVLLRSLDPTVKVRTRKGGCASLFGKIS
jgi:hypothetical protein